MKYIIPMLICAATASLTTWVISGVYYSNKQKKEFLRGMEVGVEYYKKYNQYPSMWHWEHKFKNPDFNMDTLPPIELPENSTTIVYDTSDESLFKIRRKKVKDSDSTYHYIYY